MKADIVEKAYSEAKEHYSSLGVDTEGVLALMQAYDNPWLFSAPEVGQGSATDRLTEEDCIKVVLDVPGCKEKDASRLPHAILHEWSDEERAETLVAVITAARKVQKNHLLTLLHDDAMLDAVYDEFCFRNNVPVADEYVSDIKNYI